ncbi:MAG: hypothetical protein KBT34_11625 [Prevotella sp.]|nr:hypothetical protein [Candidatus Prevotella equi]
MRYLTILFLFMSCVGTVSAQSFDALWKQYNAARDNDLPQSAISVLRKIESKAKKEAKYGHFLAAMTCDIGMCNELSPDSAKAQQNRLMLWEQNRRMPVAALASCSQISRNDAIAAFVCRTVIARYNYYLSDKPEGYEPEKVKAVLDSIANDKDILPLFTQKDASLQYVPMVQKGEDSRIFNHDLFSLLCMEMKYYELMERYYSSIGNRQAACLMASKWIIPSIHGGNRTEQKQEGIQRADSLIAIYQDLSECGEIALVKAELMKRQYTLKAKDRYDWIEEALRRWPASNAANMLRNMRNDMILPRLDASMNQLDIQPNKDLKLYLNHVKNVQSVCITITPMTCDGMYQFGDLYDNANYTKLKRLMDSQNSRAFQYQLNRDGKYADYEHFNDSVSIGSLPVGVYMIEATPTAGNSAASFEKMKTDRQILCVSDLRIVSLKLPHDRLRVAVVSATTGQPQAGAVLHLRKDRSKKWTEYTTDNNGECIISNADSWLSAYATTATDKASSDVSIYNTYYYDKNTGEIKNVKAFTDRALYRPGQTVHMSAICYKVKHGVDVKVQAGVKVPVILRDSQYNDIAKDTLTTDEYGTIATSFVLPTNARNGNFSIICDNNNRVYFKVEEYKRPTYEVTIDEPTVDYHVGDTLVLTGKAKAYSGAGIANARVAYIVKRTTPWFLRHFSENEFLLCDTIETNEQGIFTIRMPMTLPDSDDFYENMPFYMKRYFPRVSNIEAEVVVASLTGESHSGRISVPLSERTTFLNADIKDKYFGDNGVKMQITRFNSRGKEIEGSVQIILDDLPKLKVEANKEFYLPNDITSGAHKLTAICEQDTLEATFVVFRLSDEKPAFKTSDWFYLDESHWQEDGKSVALQFGSSDNDVHVLYAIASGDSIIESGTARLNNSNITRYFDYKPEYGDGLTLAYAWTKDGKTYVHNASIVRPLPSKELKVEWKTFRNKLLPGQKEQWQMVIKDKDGKPSKAMVMATMFDKSLDAIKRHSWSFYDPRSLYLPNINWAFSNGDYLYIGISSWAKALDYKTYSFSCFNPEFMEHHSHGVFDCVESAPMMTKSKVMIMTSTAPMAKQSSLMARDEVMSNNALIGSIGGMPQKEMAVGYQKAEAETEADIMPRTNFNETAFFMPQLITDNNGVATLSFTLPESVTTWRIMALAHDKEMRFGMLNDEVIAQKQLMVQPRMPRFLRKGDKATLSSMVTNLSEKDIKATVAMTLLDAKTEKKIAYIYNKVLVKAGGTQVVTFPIEDFGGEDLICKVTAQGNGYSDGEQQVIPVLKEEELKPDTTPIVVNPRKIMMEALPAIKTPDSDNAISLTSAYYANMMSAYLKDSLALYDGSALLGRLQALQNTDGSLSWFKGMDGSIYLTTEAMKMLSRLNSMIGRQSSTAVLMDKAFSYLQKEMEKQVKEMKKEEAKKIKPTLTYTQLDWLYALTLEGRDGGSAAAYLRNLIEEDTKGSDMMTKSVAAIVLDANKKAKQADTFAESIKQHTVYRADMGRYFDSYRAQYSWCSYRIPTQTMAIEALSKVTPEDNKTIAEMQRWLVSAKRTQRWDCPINAVNAIFAFHNAKDTTVTATFIVNHEDIKDALTIKREADIEKVVGGKAKIRLTITADRDYDFVTVTDNRPACLEPVAQLSGYHHGYYQEMKDSKTNYYFNKLRKGTHVIETEYYVERAGTYSSGNATVVCTYAPEFHGTDNSYNIECKQNK